MGEVELAFNTENAPALPLPDASRRTDRFGNLHIGIQQRRALDNGLCDEQTVERIFVGC